jgi:phosphoribosylformimino-5-aminoimidazole carboxamide ribotide isomerase
VQKVKIIPAIDLMDGQVVRLLKGNPKNKTVYSNNPQEIAKKWEKQGADMIHLVDLDATLGLGSNIDIIKKITREASIPIQVGGGLRSESAIISALDFAQRVVVGTIAFKDFALVSDLATKFGKKRIVISIDHNNGIIVTNGWQKSTGINLIEAAKSFSKKNFTEFLLTNVSRDGTLQGPDLENLAQICNLENANVIASGGISGPTDITKIKQCNAYGVILGKALYDEKITIKEAKQLA